MGQHPADPGVVPAAPLGCWRKSPAEPQGWEQALPELRVRRWAQCWAAGPPPTRSGSVPGRCRPLCHADALLSEHNWKRVPSQAVPVHADLPVWAVYLLIHYLKKEKQGEIKLSFCRSQEAAPGGCPAAASSPVPHACTRQLVPITLAAGVSPFFFFFQAGAN